jgi:hypothetical protein
MPMVPRSLAVLLALAVGGCVYPGTVTGSAPVYSDGYQPVMGGYASEWPAQPGAMWGPEDVPSVDVFYEPLAQHGRWIQSQWGQAFQPAAPQGWRPYQNGQWLDNRFWMSGDAWGWATDHYGRWGFDQAIGWVWVPGTNWGPSWVAWREADEVVGWAPIPPRVSWNVGIGFGQAWGYDNWNNWYGPSWVWVPRGTLYARGFGGRILPWNTGLNYWGRTRWQHAPYWGWNQPWDRGWGWHAPGRGWGNGDNQGYYRGYPGRNPGWNGDPRRNGWAGDPRRNGWAVDPRRGQPGSVGDRIGRDLTGQPQRPPQGWNGNTARRDGVAPGGRPDGRRGDMVGGPNGWGNGNGGRNGGNGNPGAGNRPPRANGPGAGVSGMIGGAIAAPRQQQVQVQPQAQPVPQPRPQREYTAPPVREAQEQRTEPSGPARETYRDERRRNPY